MLSEDYKLKTVKLGDHKISYKFKGEIPDEVKERMKDYAQDIKEIDKKMLDLNYIVNKYNNN